MPIKFFHGSSAARGGAIDCPHCGGPLRTRSNREVTPTYRQLYLICPNLDCHATFGASLTIEHQVAQSLCPNPAVRLRFAPPRRQAANDNPIATPEDLRAAPGTAGLPPEACNESAGLRSARSLAVHLPNVRPSRPAEPFGGNGFRLPGAPALVTFRNSRDATLRAIGDDLRRSRDTLEKMQPDKRLTAAATMIAVAASLLNDVAAESAGRIEHFNR